MLAELFQLARNLHAQGIPISLVHRDFDKPGLSTYITFKATLDKAGHIVELLPILEDEKVTFPHISGHAVNG